MHAAVEDPSAYPRTYRPPPAWIIYSWFVALGTLGVGVLGGLAGLWPMRFRGPTDAATAAAMGVMAFVLGCYMIAGMRKVRVTLHADAIEVVRYGTPLALIGLRPPRRLKRDEIVNRSFTHGRGARSMLIHDRDGRTTRLPMIFRTDAAFTAWFKAIPVLTRRTSLLRALRRSRASAPR
jgi:hypothetical protein